MNQTADTTELQTLSETAAGELAIDRARAGAQVWIEPTKDGGCTVEVIGENYELYRVLK